MWELIDVFINGKLTVNEDIDYIHELWELIHVFINGRLTVNEDIDHILSILQSSTHVKCKVVQLEMTLNKIEDKIYS